MFLLTPIFLIFYGRSTKKYKIYIGYTTARDITREFITIYKILYVCENTLNKIENTYPIPIAYERFALLNFLLYYYFVYAMVCLEDY